MIAHHLRPRLNQKLAAKEVAKAIRNDILKKPALFLCEDCGIKAECYDHREYAKPLQVQPVCRCCNVRRGPAIDSDAIETYFLRKRKPHIVQKSMGFSYGQVVNLAGGVIKLADLLLVCIPTVKKWKNKIPEVYMHKICDARPEWFVPKAAK